MNSLATNALDGLYQFADLLLGIGLVVFILMAAGGVFKDDW